MGFVKNLFTYSNNSDWNIGNLGGGAALVSHIVYTGYDLIALHHPFEAHTFGIGVAAILGGMMAHQKFTDPGLSGGNNASISASPPP